MNHSICEVHRNPSTQLLLKGAKNESESNVNSNRFVGGGLQ